MVYLHPCPPGCGPYLSTARALMVYLHDNPIHLNMTFCVLARVLSCLVLADGRHSGPCISPSALASNLDPAGNAVPAVALTTPNEPKCTPDASPDPTHAPHLHQASDVLCTIISSSLCTPDEPASQCRRGLSADPLDRLGVVVSRYCPEQQRAGSVLGKKWPYRL